MYNFRFHRGGFKESMMTKRTYGSIYSLVHDLAMTENVPRKDIFIQYYGFDSRLSVPCFLVTKYCEYQAYPIGFMWEDFPNGLMGEDL